MTAPDNSFRAGFSLLGNPNVNRTFIAYLISYAGTAMAPIAMAAQLCIAALFLTGLATVPWLTFFMLINGIAVALHAPAATGLIIQLVDPKDFQATNALLGTARNGAVAGGAALGGILVATFGAGVTLAIDAVSFGISAALIASLRPRIQTPPDAASLFEDLRQGWKEFTSHTWLWVIVLQFSLVVAAGESVYGLLGPAVVRDHLGGAVDWGFIASGFGVLWYTTLQNRVPSQMLSRVSAYDHLGSIVLAPLGIVVAGYLFEQLGFRITLLIMAAAVIVPTLLVLCVRDVRWMTAVPTTRIDSGS